MSDLATTEPEAPVVEEAAVSPDAAASASPEEAPAPADVAQDEVAEEPEPKKVTWRDLELTLPEKLPATILFDLTTIELAGEDPMPAFRLLQSMLGEEQFVQVRNEVAVHNLDLSEVVGERGLMAHLFEPYGIGLGE